MATLLQPSVDYLFNHNCLEWTQNLCPYPVDRRKPPSKPLVKTKQNFVYPPFASRAAATLLGIDSQRLSKKFPSISWVQTTSRAFARHPLTVSGPSAKCKNHSWSTKGGYGPPGLPGPPWSTLIHIFGKISKSVDQSRSEWTRLTTGTTTPLGVPGAFKTTLDHAPTFSWWIQSLCYFPSSVLNTQIPLESLNFSTMHSSLKMTPSKSSCVQSLYSSAQASLLEACLSCSNALSLALDYLMLTDAKPHLMLLTKACGATSLYNSAKGRCRAFLDILTSLRWVLVWLIVSLPGMGRFFP